MGKGTFGDIPPMEELPPLEELPPDSIRQQEWVKRGGAYAPLGAGGCLLLVLALVRHPLYHLISEAWSHWTSR